MALSLSITSEAPAPDFDSVHCAAGRLLVQSRLQEDRVKQRNAFESA